ncbi:MAG: hypothetical protein AAF682_32865 [Planctomycetota bacterium]
MSDDELRDWTVDAPLSAVCVDRAGIVAAFAGGDGAVRICPLGGGDLVSHSLVDGAVLALAPDWQPGAFLAGADDGGLYRITLEGSERLLQLPRAFPEHIVTHPGGARAIADGQDIRLLDADGDAIGTLTGHASTVAGLQFDQAGERLAVSHYDGASVWDLSSRTRTHSLYFRGSHLSLSWQPEGRYLVTATQEKMLHAWALETGEDVSLGPSFLKVRSLGWSADGMWLLAAGNDTVSGWRFHRGLPSSPAAKMLGRYSEDYIGLVCPHPVHGLTAVGYNDGGLELIVTESRSSRRVLTEPGGTAVVAMAWSPDGNHLVGGDKQGRLFVRRFGNDWLARLIDGT